MGEDASVKVGLCVANKSIIPYAYASYKYELHAFYHIVPGIYYTSYQIIVVNLASIISYTFHSTQQQPTFTLFFTYS